MTSAPLPQPRFRASSALRAIVFGLAVGISAPLMAETLADVRRLIKQGQYPQALAAVDVYLGSSPDDVQASFLKGVIYGEMNRTDEAIAVYSKLTEDYPEFPEPYNNLAVLYASQKQYDRARMALEMAIQAHPSYATAYENLGDLYAKLASQAYGKAVQLEGASKSAKAKLLLARDLIAVPSRSPAKPADATDGDNSAKQ
ncbi:MAG TPA: tetratricopeptide repeat protein [Azonexus sp.]|nr:tetratricopeptide repeat protein [Azonexus sp.]